VAVGEPLFVVRIDADARQVVVGPREALLTRALALTEFNWLGDGAVGAPDFTRPVLAKVRSTRDPVPGELRRDADGGLEVALASLEEGVARGQACVLYAPERPERVLGGGFIAGATAA
jgi:tRNA-specific 2-thiouridylase